MSKSSLNMFTKSMAALLAPEIRVNSVNPGPVKMSIKLPGIENYDEFYQTMASATALNKFASPEEIAKLIAFLASDAAANMTGSIVVSDSGLLIKDPMKSK